MPCALSKPTALESSDVGQTYEYTSAPANLPLAAGMLLPALPLMDMENVTALPRAVISVLTISNADSD